MSNASELSPPQIILFQTYYRLDPWGFTPAVESFGDFELEGSDTFKLKIKYELEFQHQDEGPDEPQEPHILIQALLRQEVTSIEAIKVLSQDLKIDIFGTRMDEMISRNGLGGFHKEYQELVLAVHKDMDRMATNLFNTTRWRTGLTGGPLVLASQWSRLRWQPETEVSERDMHSKGFLSYQIPAGVFTLDLPETQPLSVCEDSRASIKSLFTVGQPLYHDILREAWQNQDANPRSAVAMAIAAAETAFKATVTDLEPSTSWLIENIPSPPIVQMMRKYMELLPARNTFNGKVKRPPTSMITIISNGVTLRNELVHGRAGNVNQADLRNLLSTVRDFLYLLDYYRGHAWALDRITPETLAELKSTKS